MTNAVHEIELKLCLTPEFLANFSQHFSAFNNNFHEEIQLISTYFDRADLALSQQKAIVRTRESRQNGESQFSQTVKLKGTVSGGVHNHPEINTPLENNALNFQKFAENSSLALPSILHAGEEKHFQPLFCTNFQRKTWLVPFNDSEIEVALDVGSVRAGNQTTPLAELECELKQGDPLDLIAFVFQHIEENGAVLCGINKAKRGYALALGQTPAPVDFDALWQRFMANAHTPQEKMAALLPLEQQLIDQTLNLGLTNFSQNITALRQVIMAFMALYQNELNARLAYVHAFDSLPEKVRVKFPASTLEDFLYSQQNAYEFVLALAQALAQTNDSQAVAQSLWQWLYHNVELKRMLVKTLLHLAQS